MSNFFFSDESCGVLVFVSTEAEALEGANSCLEIYRHEAIFDGEWEAGVEDVKVGIVPAQLNEAEKQDLSNLLVTHRATPICDGVGETDYFMRPVATANLEAQVV